MKWSRYILYEYPFLNSLIGKNILTRANRGFKINFFLWGLFPNGRHGHERSDGPGRSHPKDTPARQIAQGWQGRGLIPFHVGLYPSTSKRSPAAKFPGLAAVSLNPWERMIKQNPATASRPSGKSRGTQKSRRSDFKPTVLGTHPLILSGTR